jgi:oligoendopeptidase F
MNNLIRPLPQDVQEFSNWTWEHIEPYYARLRAIELDADNVHAWLADWTQLATLIDERHQRLYLATTQNTADRALEEQFNHFVEHMYPNFQAAEQTLKEKFVASGLQPHGFEIPLRNLRAEANLFRAENLPLITQEQKYEKEFDKLIGSETVQWDGEEFTPTQMLPFLQSTDRATRERAWHLIFARRLQNRAALNDLWQRSLQLHLQMAKNAGYLLQNSNGEPLGDYRAFRWHQYQRFDYTPDDCKNFADAIEQVVVPVAARLYEKYRQRLGVETLRPWDLQGPMGFFVGADPVGAEPLHPFKTDVELIEKCAAIFRDVDPELGAYFETMRAENLLDLPNRKNKGPGGFCMNLEHSRRPFIS